MPNIEADPRVWRADTVGEPESWRYSVAEEDLTTVATAIRAVLESGRGFAIVASGEPECDVRSLYLRLGSLLGRPVEQNVQGTLLYDVKDTGQDVRYGARFSVTNAESTFHTDASFMERVTDYVGLLCVNDAKSGGLSQIVSGYAVQAELRAHYPAAWAELTRVFHVDRRGGTRPDESPTAQYPVFSETDRGLIIRYLRYWIEVGHEKAGVPLTEAQREALDLLDRVAGDPRLRAEFALQPGEMLFVNNRWILHNRTAFEDHVEPERRRHLLRLWMAV